MAKITILGKIPEAVPVQVQGCTGTHPQQKENCTGTGQRCTGIAQQNATCTGTGQSCTGIAVPKMSRIVYFFIFKPKFTHRLHKNLIK